MSSRSAERVISGAQSHADIHRYPAETREAVMLAAYQSDRSAWQSTSVRAKMEDPWTEERASAKNDTSFFVERLSIDSLILSAFQKRLAAAAYLDFSLVSEPYLPSHINPSQAV